MGGTPHNGSQQPSHHFPVFTYCISTQPPGCIRAVSKSDVKKSSHSFQNSRTGPRRILDWTQENPGHQHLQALDDWGGPAPARLGHVALQGWPVGLGLMDPHNDTGLGHRDSPLLRPQVKAFNPVLKEHKADALLDVDECMRDPKRETLCYQMGKCL